MEKQKLCRKCGKLKPLSEFHKKSVNRDGYRNECKSCVKEYETIYRQETKDRKSGYDKQRYIEKREEILEYKKEYHQKNKEIILEKKEKYRKENKNDINFKRRERYKNDEEYREKVKQWKKDNKEKWNDYLFKFRIEHKHEIAWRSVLYSTLKRLGTSKEGHTIDMLGYSALELKEHLTNLFTPGMSWDNYGEWQIDHRTAVANFDENSDIKEVCALSNLQPLWMTTRIIDGVEYIGNLNKNIQ